MLRGSWRAAQTLGIHPDLALLCKACEPCIKMLFAIMGRVQGFTQFYTQRQLKFVNPV